LISKKAKYGLKALLMLAQVHGKDPVLIVDISKKERIPKKFLELILLELKRHGLVQSKKGKGGGYFLSRNPGSITLGDVIRFLDGPIALVPCVSRTAYRKCEDCEDEATCGIRIVMKEVRDAMGMILDGTTLSDVIRLVEAKSRLQQRFGA
jgi:Rrf2 family protein